MQQLQICRYNLQESASAIPELPRTCPFPFDVFSEGERWNNRLFASCLDVPRSSETRDEPFAVAQVRACTNCLEASMQKIRHLPGPFAGVEVCEKTGDPLKTAYTDLGLHVEVNASYC